MIIVSRTGGRRLYLRLSGCLGNTSRALDLGVCGFVDEGYSVQSGPKRLRRQRVTGLATKMTSGDLASSWGPTCLQECLGYDF